MFALRKRVSSGCCSGIEAGNTLLEPRLMMLFFKNRLRSFGYAFRGVAGLFRGQINIWLHVVAALMVVAAGFCFGISKAEWLAVVLSVAMVLGAEAFNTALERLTDMVSPDYDRRAGEVKDVAAGAVLLVSLGALVVGLVVFVPYIIDLFSNG